MLEIGLSLPGVRAHFRTHGVEFYGRAMIITKPRDVGVRVRSKLGNRSLEKIRQYLGNFPGVLHGNGIVMDHGLGAVKNCSL